MVRYAYDVPGFEDRSLEVEVTTLGTKRLFLDGAPPPRQGSFTLTRTDGTQVEARFTAVNLGLDVPQLLVEGRTYDAVAPLPGWHVAWAAAPVLLVFVSCLVGLVVGVLVGFVNIQILRRVEPPWRALLVTGAINVVVVGGWLTVASILMDL
ncbi:hypothetical protein [Aeromicrobium alkaliterrae]|uniref:Uncharacterized protein n=1 Tax=Aeromicrobium alkaliterrae TaxID=302168 RepID=A0ABP4VLG2_9ACTN